MLKNTPYGFEQLKQHVKNYTPEWASKITELDANKIRKAAYIMAEASPSSCNTSRQTCSMVR